MNTLTVKNIYNLDDELICFINKYKRGHIRNESVQNLSKNCIGIVLLNCDIIGLTAMNDNYSITVIHPDYQNKNIGTLLMALKLKLYFELVNKSCYITKVGATNIASLKMCLKLGGQVIDVGQYQDNGKAWLNVKITKEGVYDYLARVYKQFI